MSEDRQQLIAKTELAMTSFDARCDWCLGKGVLPQFNESQQASCRYCGGSGKFRYHRMGKMPDGRIKWETKDREKMILMPPDTRW